MSATGSSILQLARDLSNNFITVTYREKQFDRLLAIQFTDFVSNWMSAEIAGTADEPMLVFHEYKGIQKPDVSIPIKNICSVDVWSGGHTHTPVVWWHRPFGGELQRFPAL